MLAFPDFPKAHDILAIAKIESGYNEKARNGISRGIMQVNHGPWGLVENVQAGVKLLREYYEKLGSAKAAIVAYNLGIGNYLKGKRNQPYFLKYQGAKNEIVLERIDSRNRNISTSSTDDVPSIRISGSSGGLLFNPVSISYSDTVFERDSEGGNFLHETSRAVSPSLGTMRKEDP